MDIQQIIDYIKTSVKNREKAFAEKGLEYNPEIIASATFKELRQLDPSLDHDKFDEAIDRLQAEGFIDSRANGLVFFKEAILS